MVVIEAKTNSVNFDDSLLHIEEYGRNAPQWVVFAAMLLFLGCLGRLDDEFLALGDHDLARCREFVLSTS